MRIKRALIALGVIGLGAVWMPAKSQAAGPPIAPSLTQIHIDSVTITWGLPLPTSGYMVQASTFPAFTGGIISTSTFDQNQSTLTLTGLPSNTTFYFRAGALYFNTTSYTMTSPTSTVTLANVVANPFILQTGPSQITVRWDTLANCAGYLLDVSTSINFAPIYSTSTTNPAVATMTVSGLTGGTTYFVRVGTLNAKFVPNFVLAGSTVTGGLAPPAGLTGHALSPTSINWTWGPVPGFASFSLYMASSPTTAIATGISTGAYTETGLSTNTAHSRVVTVIVSAVESGLSNSATTYTLAVAPNTPTFGNIYFTSATVSWSPPKNPIGTPYAVSMSTTSGFTAVISTPVTFAQDFQTFTTDFLNLNSATTYYVRIQAQNGDGLGSPFSPTNSFTTATPLVPAPTGLAGQPLGTSSITWTWNAVSSATSYNMYMSTSPTTLVAAGIATTTYAEINLSTNVIYGRVVTALIGAVESAPSSPATRFTLAANPAAATFSQISTGSVTLSWTNPGNPAGTRYSISKSTTPGFTVGISTPITFAQNFTAYTTNFTGLAPGTTYYFRVQAANGDDIPTSLSPVNGVMTVAMAPAGLSGTAVSPTSIHWTWGVVPGFSSFNLYLASSPTTAVATGISTTSYTEMGLSTNTAYARVLTAIVGGVETAPSSTGTAVTQAVIPGGPTYTNIGISSATLSWTANGNTGGTPYEVSRSSSPGFIPSFTMITFSANFTGTTTTFFTLAPGTTYYFRVRARNSASFVTAFSTGTSVLTLPGGGGGGSGPGSATIAPATVQEAGVVTATMTFTVPSQGMNGGGRLEISMPNGWGPQPQTGNPGGSGYVAVLGGATFNVTTSSQGALLTLASGFLSSGTTLQFAFQNLYTNCPTQTFPQALWKVRSAMTSSSSDPLVDVPAPAPQSYTVGPLQSVNFVPWNVISMGANQVSPPLLLQTSDSCGQPVPLAAPLAVTWSGLQSDQVAADPTIQFSTNSFANTTNTLTIPASVSTATLYVRSTTSGNNRWIRGTYTHPTFGTPYQAWRQVNVLSQSFAFTNATVDNGTAVNGQTTMTLTPDSDGSNDNAYIRFSPNDSNTQWHVAISSDGFQYSVYERWGSGDPFSSVMWDGRDFHTNFVVPNDNYVVKLEDVNGATVNTSLSFTVTTAKISGQVSLGGTPVAGAWVNANGTNGTAAGSYAAARTDALGNYAIYGLRSGSTYNLYTSFISTSTQAQISGQFSNVTAPATNKNFVLSSPGILRVAAVSPNPAGAAVYGSVNLYSGNVNYWGNIHLTAGTTTSDNGDYFNPSTWTALGVVPGTYTLHLNMQGYGAADQVVNVPTNQTTDVVVTLLARANVYGKITLNSPATTSLWVPVQGQLQGSNFPSVYGGAYFGTGQQQAIYSLFAVSSGAYVFSAQPPGFVALKTTQTVDLTDIGNVSTGGLDFSGFLTGGSISGNITINGNTTTQPADPMTIWINAFSPQLGQNAFTQIQLPTHATQTSGSYSIGGLADGTYQVNPPYFPGFSSTGPQTVVVSGGTGNLNIVLNENTGKITGTVTLPNGNGDYNNVHLSLQGPISREVDLSATPYSLDQLDTGYYRLIASYGPTGAQVRLNVAVTNGSPPQNIPIDLRISTFSVSGTVSVQSGFNMTDSSGAAVTVSTIQNLLDAATQQTLILGGVPMFNGPTSFCSGGTATVLTTARVEAFPKDFDSYHQANRSGLTNCFGVNQYKYGTIAPDGSYAISGLTPGIWEINVYPYFDNGSSPNVSVQKQVVSILNTDIAGKDFTLAGGNSVGGTISLPDGVTDFRSFYLSVQTDRGDIVQSTTLDIGVAGTPAPSATYEFTHLASGNYSLVLQDLGTFDSTQNRNVIRYVAKPVQFQITGGDLSSVNMTLSNAGRIVGKLAIQGSNADGTSALTLITSNNSNLLSSNFNIQAQANPWVPSGYAQASMGPGGIQFNSDNQFSIDGLIAGTYDVYFRQFTYGGSTQGSLDLAAYTQGGVSVPQGQTLDLGTITLQPGLAVSGLVTDTSGTPLANIRVRAHAANSHHGSDDQEVFTNSSGLFTFTGLSPKVKIYDFIAAPRPFPNEKVQPVPFGQVKKRTVDVTQVPPPSLTFALPAATAGFTGTVVTVDSGPLSYPDGDEAGWPAAAIFVNLQGNNTADNPLGDNNASALDGTFNITNLPAGIYDLTIESLGYRPVKMTGVTLGSTIKSLGTITLQKGPALTATLTKPDGSAVNTNDVHQAVAASADLSSIIFGQINSDAQTNNIVSIKFGGFELSPKVYSILLFDTHDNIIVPQDGRNLVFTANDDSVAKAITFQPTAPQALVNIQKSGSDVLVTFYFSRPLRNGVNDQIPSEWVTTTGGGSLSNVILSGDRRQLSVTYTPAVDEQNAVIHFSAHTVDIDATTGVEYVLAKNVTLLLGQKATAEQSINPAIGGNVSLSDALDASQVALPANALLNTNGSAADATTSYALVMSATDDPDSVGASALSRAPRIASMMRRGSAAYLSEAYAAMQSARAQATINPLSSFYSILLPAGLSHSLNQTATLTLHYDTSADPNLINVYFYNGSQYIIEQALRSVDTTNHTISVGVSHFSTFVVLENNQPVVQVNGDTSSGADITVYNFPNPFNLDSKTKTLTNGGTSTTLTTEGTIIHYTIPAAKAGSASIEIYNVVGEKVRTISLGAPAVDTHNYVEWNGRNDSGKKVASGVYIGMLKVGGEKKFFKMAVIK